MGQKHLQKIHPNDYFNPPSSIMHFISNSVNMQTNRGNKVCHAQMRTTQTTSSRWIPPLRQEVKLLIRVANNGLHAWQLPTFLIAIQYHHHIWNMHVPSASTAIWYQIQIDLTQLLYHWTTSQQVRENTLPRSISHFTGRGITTTDGKTKGGGQWLEETSAHASFWSCIFHLLFGVWK